MASCDSNTSGHSRSISLPSRSHPLLPEIEDQLSSFESTSTSSQSNTTTSLTHRISNVKNLFDCVDQLMLILQANHHSNIPNDVHSSATLNDLLDGSLKLLDICSVSKEALLQMKESIQTTQSSLRRRGSGGGQLTITSDDVGEYISCRKKVKKIAKKTLKEISTTDQRSSSGTAALGGVLRRSEIVAVKTFESLLLFISGTKTTPQLHNKNNKSGWCVVSKLLLGKAKASRHQSSVEDVGATSTGNVFQDVDLALGCLLSGGSKKGVEDLRSEMVRLESEILQLDQVLECLFRRLVKTRATLLNVFSD